MSTKIAPAPPPHLAPSLPRIAFLPNQQPVLLIPKSYTGHVSIPVRVSPKNERPQQQFQFIQPKPPMQHHYQEEAPRGSREDPGIAEYLPSTQQRRDILKRKIEERPSKQYLIRKHILLTDPLVEPFVGEKTHQLRKQAVVSNLNRKLKSRPGPLDLVTKKILQADAELEEAIKEGRLLFPSSRRELESPSPSIPQAPSPSVLLSSLRISKQESIREEREREEREAQAYHQYHAEQGMMDGDEPQEDQRGRKYGRVEARAQPHPYARLDATQPSPAKGRLKGPDTKSAAEYTAIPDNFEAMMKQQELFIEWRTRPDGSDQGPQSHSHTLQPHEDGGESDSGETIPYGDEEDDGRSAMPATTTITYRVYPEQPAEAPDSTVIMNHSKNAPRCTNGNVRAPIFSLADIKKTDLMQECRNRGLKCGGDKTTIMQRLEGLKDEIIAKFKEENARLEALAMENSPQISSERALSNTSSSSSPSTIIEDMAFDGNGMGRIDESIAHRRHSLPSNNPHHGMARSLNPPTRHLSMSSGSHPQAAAPTINTLSFSQNPHQHGQNDRRIQMKTSNGDIFYATLPSTDDLPIPRDGKPIGCKIAIVNGKPVLQFQPSGPIEPEPVGDSGIRDTLLFAQNGSGGQVTLGPNQKERHRSNSLNRKSSYPEECNSISSLLRSNSTNSSLPVVVQRTSRPQSTSTTMSGKAALRAHLSLPREQRKSSQSQVKSPQQPPQPPKESSAQPQETYQPQDMFQPQEIGAQETVQHIETAQPQATIQPGEIFQLQEAFVTEEVVETSEEKPKKELSEVEQVAAHANAINKLLNREIKLTLDAKTVLEHEQALRGQQRMIDQLQKELKKSYTALKLQQQLISSAKKAQSAEIQKMTNNKIKNIGEAWLFELNLKRLHKSNNNFFLTHEQQEKELQALAEEQKKIQQQHINIQISEASDSAIKDITKFIGANPKTALLIVQLLKKYQNDKVQAAAQPTQTFADIPAFEASEKTPKPDPANSHDYIMESQPGPSHHVDPAIDPYGHDDNGNVGGGSQEAIVIDDDSQDEDVAPPQQRLRLAAPPMRNRRKDQRVTNITQVDMEAIFRTVLDGSKTGNGQVHMHSGSPADANMNKIGENSSPHSVSSIPSSHSMAGLGPSDSSSSPCSSSTPPEMMMHHNMMHPQMHYGNQNLYPVRAVSDGPIDYSMAMHPPPYESLGRPYVREGVSADDNPTDILMEAVESSGIVDDGIGGGDEPMPSSSHSMQPMHHDHLMMHHDDNVLLNQDYGVGDNLILGDQGYDFLNDASIFSNFDPAAFEGFDPRALEEVPSEPAPTRRELETYYDLADIINNDEPFEKRSPDSKKVSYNGTEELNKILGPSWMDMDGDASTSGDHPMHPMQLEIPGGSLLPHDDAFEDVFAPSSHVDGLQSASSSLAPPHSPMITDMTWLNDEEVRAALSPKGPPFGDEFDGFDPTNP